MADRGLMERQAALFVVIGTVLTIFGAPIAEFIVSPSLVDPAYIEGTVPNMRANEGAFLTASFA